MSNDSIPTLTEYGENALSTVAPVTPDVVERLEGHFQEIMNLIQGIAFYADRLDVLKKHVFYGKEMPNTHRPCLYPMDVFPHRLYMEDATPTLEAEVNFWHGLIGLLAEGGEFYNLVFHNGSRETAPLVDDVNLLEEIGDVAWYLNLIAASTNKNPGISMLGVALRMNNEKLLKRRYKDGKFSQAAAINRDLYYERQGLEEAHTDLGSAVDKTKT